MGHGRQVKDIKRALVGDGGDLWPGEQEHFPPGEEQTPPFSQGGSQTTDQMIMIIRMKMRMGRYKCGNDSDQDNDPGGSIKMIRMIRIRMIRIRMIRIRMIRIQGYINRCILLSGI